MITIVIPVHNRKNYTKACLRSLNNQTVNDHNIIIVDDGSTDGTAEMIASEFPDVEVLRGDGSLFWTASINMGIRHALRTDVSHVLTLNNDTIASETFIENMMLWSKRVPGALLGALDVDYNSGKRYYGGEIVHPVWDTSRMLLNIIPRDQQHGIHRVSLFPGRGLLIPREVFDKIGLFQERLLPHYLADYDFTRTASQNGIDVYCNYDAVLYTFPEEGGDHKIRKNKSIRNYFNHLFGIKGGGNLKNFTIYTMRHSPYYLWPVHLLKGYVQRIGGYLLH